MIKHFFIFVFVSLATHGWTQSLNTSNNINKEDSAGSLRLYPNPANRYLFVLPGDKDVVHGVLIVLDEKGSQVMQVKEFSPGLIDISSLKPGSYSLQFINSEKKYPVARFVKE